MARKFKLSGRYEIIVRESGLVVLTRKGKNTIHTAGFALGAQLMLGLGTAISYAGFGDSAAAINIAHTALQGTEHFRSLLTKSAAGALFTLSDTIVGPGVTVTIREIGIFNAATAGTMFARFLPTTYTFGPGQEMDFNWTGELE